MSGLTEERHAAAIESLSLSLCRALAEDSLTRILLLTSIIAVLFGALAPRGPALSPGPISSPSFEAAAGIPLQTASRGALTLANPGASPSSLRVALLRLAASQRSIAAALTSLAYVFPLTEGGPLARRPQRRRFAHGRRRSGEGRAQRRAG